jgi:hypothetical protein
MRSGRILSAQVHVLVTVLAQTSQFAMVTLTYPLTVENSGETWRLAAIDLMPQIDDDTEATPVTRHRTDRWRPTMNPSLEQHSQILAAAGIFTSGTVILLPALWLGAIPGAPQRRATEVVW